jgi:hypothetical protein
MRQGYWATTKYRLEETSYARRGWLVKAITVPSRTSVTYETVIDDSVNS